MLEDESARSWVCLDAWLQVRTMHDALATAPRWKVSCATVATLSRREVPCHVAGSDNLAIHSDQDSLAEWSKALAQGASPQGRGFEPHSCQPSCTMLQKL